MPHGSFSYITVGFTYSYFVCNTDMRILLRDHGKTQMRNLKFYFEDLCIWKAEWQRDRGSSHGWARPTPGARTRVDSGKPSASAIPCASQEHQKEQDSGSGIPVCNVGISSSAWIHYTTIPREVKNLYIVFSSYAISMDILRIPLLGMDFESYCTKISLPLNSTFLKYFELPSLT